MTTQANGNNLLVQGRIVWITGNSLFEGKKMTDFNTGAPILGDDGLPVMEYGFGLAIPKLDPRTQQHSAEFVKIWQTLHAEAFTLYPSGQLPPDFAMKFKDGDTDRDDKGQPYSTREGYAGHIVLACTTRIPLKCFIYQGGNNILVNSGIKSGDYVNVQLNIKAHPPKGRGKPGLYLNPSAVQLIQEGKEIITTPSGDQMFGQQAPQYNGQVVAPAVNTMPNMQAQAPVYAPQAPVQQQAAPHYDVLPPNHQPQYPQQQVAPQQPVYAPQAPVQQQAAPQYAQGAPAMPPLPGQR